MSVHERSMAHFLFENRPMSEFQIGNERHERSTAHFLFENRPMSDFQIGNERHERSTAHFLFENRPMIDFKKRMSATSDLLLTCYLKIDQ